MLNPFINFINQQHLFDFSQEVLLAISGGRDSVAMCELFARAGARFAIAHCNFHLRPGDCDRDEAFVRSLGEKYGVEVHVAQFDTNRDAREWKCSIEETARRERYEYFERLCVCYHYVAVATAHHMDDSIETFFINLLRGTGIAGLHGILPRNGRVIRPMLCFSRKEIDNFVIEEKLPYVDDYTNDDVAFRRNMIRHKIVPLLRDMAPSFDRTMTENMSRLLDVEMVYREVVESLRSRVLEKDPRADVWRLKISEIDGLSPQRTMLFELLRPFGFTLDVVNNLLESIHCSCGKRFYSSDYRMVVERGFVEIARRDCLIPEHETIALEQLLCEEEWVVGELVIRVSVVDMVCPASLVLDKNSVALDLSKLSSSMTMRHWRRGDRFYPLGMRGSRLLSDFFKDHKLTTSQKELAWLLCDDLDRIVWIVGMRIDDRFKVTKTTDKILLLRLIDEHSFDSD